MTRSTSTDRPSRDQVLMESARIWAKRGTCSRLQVGAVFAKNGRILVTGYNGAPSGLPHCDHTCDCDLPEHGHELNCATMRPCTIAEHAERNGIAYAAKHGIALDQSEVFVTDSPCVDCAKCLINAGVRRVVFEKLYRVQDGIFLLRDAWVDVEQLTLD